MAYIQSYKDQNWLLPQSIRDMIPKDHICFLVEDFMESLDFSEFDLSYEGAGHPAYHPRILMKIIMQGMLCGERSSRRLSCACRENFVFMYLSEKVQPDFRTICRFRTNNARFIKEVFRETIKLASSHDLVDFDLISIDGTTLKANANKKRSLKKDAFDVLDNVIERMIDEDIAQDELDKQLYGDKEKNLTGMDRRDLKRIIQEYRRRKNKEEIRAKHCRIKQELGSNPKLKRVSLTDPECRMMQNKQGVSELAYNAQFSVDSKNQIILANDVCQAGHDANQLIPQINNLEENVGKLKEGTKVATDCGYSSGKNLNFLDGKKLDAYVPSRAQAQEFDGKEQSLNHDKYEYDWGKDEIIVDGMRLPYNHSYIRKDSGRKILVYQIKGTKIRKQVPEHFRERLLMKEKMQTEEGRAIYGLRKIIVEPVIGNIKQNLGFREFSLRGLNSVKTELNLVAIAHNLKKIWLKTKKARKINDEIMKVEGIKMLFRRISYFY